MAWSDPLANGYFRAGYRDSTGKQQYVKDINGDTVKYPRKSDAKKAGTEAEVQAKRKGAIDPTRLPGKTTFAEWWDLIKDERTFDSNAARTEQSVVENHLLPKFGDLSLAAISGMGGKDGELQRWINGPLKKFAPSYAGRIVATLRVLFNLARHKKIVTDDPFEDLKLPIIYKNRKKKYTREDEFKKRLPLYKREDYRLLIEFGFETGMRPGELCGAHSSALENKPNWITVAETLFVREATTFIRPWPKDKDFREVPLNARAREIVAEVLDGRNLTSGCGIPHTDGSTCESELIFRSERGLPFLPENIQQYMRRVHKANKLPAASPYTLRRGFTVWTIEGGVDPLTVQMITGHSDLDELQGYFQLTEAARGSLEAATSIRQSGGKYPTLTIVQPQVNTGDPMSATIQDEGGASGAEPGAGPSKPTQDEAGRPAGETTSDQREASSTQNQAG